MKLETLHVKVDVERGPSPSIERWCAGYTLGQLRAAEFIEEILDEEHCADEKLRLLQELAANLRRPLVGRDESPFW